MKQVMCIIPTNKWWSDKTTAPSIGPVYGEICAVLREATEMFQSGYILEGYGDEPYYAGLFIPLSEPVLEIEEELELAEAQ